MVIVIWVVNFTEARNSQCYGIKKSSWSLSNMMLLKLFLCSISTFLFILNCIFSFQMNDICIKGTAIIIMAMSVFNVFICSGN